MKPVQWQPTAVLLGVGAVGAVGMAGLFVLSFEAPDSISTAGSAVTTSATTTVPLPAFRSDVLDDEGKPQSQDPSSFPPEDPRSRLASEEEVMLFNSCAAQLTSGPICVLLDPSAPESQLPPPPPPEAVVLLPTDPGQPPEVIVLPPPPPVTTPPVVVTTPPTTTKPPVTTTPPPTTTTTTPPPAPEQERPVEGSSEESGQ